MNSKINLFIIVFLTLVLNSCNKKLTVLKFTEVTNYYHNVQVNQEHCNSIFNITNDHITLFINNVETKYIIKDRRYTKNHMNYTVELEKNSTKVTIRYFNNENPMIMIESYDGSSSKIFHNSLISTF